LWGKPTAFGHPVAKNDSII